jgi:hypothetical protein
MGIIMFLPLFIINLPVCLWAKAGAKKLSVNSMKPYDKNNIDNGNGNGEDMIASYKVSITIILLLVVYIIYAAIAITCALKYPYIEIGSIYCWKLVLILSCMPIPLTYIGIKGYEIVRKSVYLIGKIKNIPNKSVRTKLYKLREPLPENIRKIVDNVCKSHASLHDINRVVTT